MAAKQPNRLCVLFLILLSAILSNAYSQQLSVDEAILFLSDIVNNDLTENPSPYSGDRFIEINRNGAEELSFKYYWANNNNVLKEPSKINYNEIVINPNDISKISKKDFLQKKAITLSCYDQGKKCFKITEDVIKLNFALKYVDNPNSNNHYDYLHLFYLNSPIAQHQAFIATNFIIETIQNNYKTEIGNEIRSLNQFIDGESIQLKAKNGIYLVNVNLGEVINTNFILDSGASDVSVTVKVEKYLLEHGIINETNYLTPALYSIADGSIIEARRFILPSIRIKNTVVENILCSVNSSSDVMLLGKSFLDRFKSWKIDNETNQLILEY